MLLKEGDGNTIFAQVAFDDGDVEKVQLSGAGAGAFGLSKARNIRENVGGKTLVMLASTKDKHFAGLWVRATPLLENAFADANLAGIVSLLPSMDDHPMLKAISSLMGYSAPCHNQRAPLTLPLVLPSLSCRSKSVLVATRWGDYKVGDFFFTETASGNIDSVFVAKLFVFGYEENGTIHKCASAVEHEPFGPSLSPF